MPYLRTLRKRKRIRWAEISRDVPRHYERYVGEEQLCSYYGCTPDQEEIKKEKSNHSDKLSYGKTTIDGDANSANWQTLQIKNEKETVYRLKGSTLPKILLLATYVIIPVILLIITGKFYFFYSHPALCTDSQVADSLTSWVFTYNLRPCWSDLGSFTPEYNRSFNAMILTQFVFLLVGFLINLITIVKLYKNPLKGLGVNGLYNKVLATVMCQARKAFVMVICQTVICSVVLLIYFNLRFVGDLSSPDLRHTVHSQLTDSLPRYNEDGFLLREAWDNTMTDGCCGVDGYQDFSNLNMSIPSVCQTEVPPSRAMEMSAASNKTFASGCVDAVMLHIINTEERRNFAFLCLTVLHFSFLLAELVNPLIISFSHMYTDNWTIQTE